MDRQFYDAKKLQLLRLAKKESQSKVARNVGYEKETIYRAEAGKAASIELLSELCCYYGTNLHEIIYPVPRHKQLDQNCNILC